jgi:hypothetical protein
MTPQKFKDETLRTLVDLTEAAARSQPSVLIGPIPPRWRCWIC